MEIDLDTFLTTVYDITDLLYQRDYAPHKPQRPGKKPELSDSEVLTLALLAQWHTDRSERAFGRYAAKHWRSYFPRLLSQSQFNRRVRDRCGVLCRLGPCSGYLRHPTFLCHKRSVKDVRMSVVATTADAVAVAVLEAQG